LLYTGSEFAERRRDAARVGGRDEKKEARKRRTTTQVLVSATKAESDTQEACR
jgi:hypothetical protein